MQPQQQSQQPQQPATTVGSASNPQNQAQNPQGQAPRNPNSSQNTLQFSEIRDGMVIMNDGSFRTVVACRSINFDLMSDREREGVEYSYQNFLNSLYFPIQVLIRSQKVDIGPYLERLSKVRRDQDNMLLGVLMDDYINFIDDLSQEANIMDKSFFIIIPYYPAGDVSSAINQSKGLLTGIFNPQVQTNVVIDRATYEKAKDEITNRVNAVVSGLYQIGVRATQLKTKELASLYYDFYNPDTATRQPLGDFENMIGTHVQKGDGRANQPQLNREDS